MMQPSAPTIAHPAAASVASAPSTARMPHFSLAVKRGEKAPALVDYIILAEFDIDTGSTVRHSYPRSVPGVSDDWFAEHMLPEGAHNHALDWTVMFLNRGKPSLDEDWPPRHQREDNDTGSGSGSGSDPAAEGSSPAEGTNVVVGDDPSESGEEGEGERHFLHCINLVKKLDDPTVRRGAVVKAMCICSRYNFIEVFRPMLLIALEQYFQNQSPEVLASLFDVLNTADIADVPRPTPWERALMRRGFAHKYMGAVPVELLAATWTHMMNFKIGDGIIQAPIPLHTFPDETLNTSVTRLINLFGQSVMSIYNAVLTGRRVLFVGYNHAAGDVCKLVLAACALVSPPIHGILHRAFPYASLSDLSFLETPSYVAGVTNPMFEAHPEWWDVLCQLDVPGGSGTVTTAEEMMSESGGGVHLRKSNSAGGSGTSNGIGEDRVKYNGKDAGLLYPGDSALATELMAGVKAGKGESWVRYQCQEYTQALVNLVIDQNIGLLQQLSAGSLDKLTSASEIRLKRLSAAGGIDKDDADPWSRCRGKGGGVAAGGEGIRLRSCIRRMQLDKSISESNAEEAFELLSDCLDTEAELQVLLRLLPESKGGAGLLALGLLSTSTSARRNTVSLFKKLESFESTRPAVLCMNDFFKLALSRQGQEWENSTPAASPQTTAPGAAGVPGFSVGGAGKGGSEVGGGRGRTSGRRSAHA